MVYGSVAPSAETRNVYDNSFKVTAVDASGVNHESGNCAAREGGKFGDRASAEGKRYLVATFAVKNLVPSGAPPVDFDCSNFKIKLQDADGGWQEFDAYAFEVSQAE